MHRLRSSCYLHEVDSGGFRTQTQKLISLTITLSFAFHAARNPNGEAIDFDANTVQSRFLEVRLETSHCNLTALWIKILG